MRRSARIPESARRTARRRGYTLVEVAVSSALLSLVLASASSVFSTADGQVKRNRVRMRVATEHRRNLDAVASILRDADIATLTGFDVGGRSSNPSFAKVTGALLNEREHGETLQLVWRPDPRPVDGVAFPGAVHLVSASREERVATRVPKGGFEVRQEGSTLVIRISTYYTTADRLTSLLTCETAVTLRN